MKDARVPRIHGKEHPVKFILKLSILTALLTATTYIGGCNTTKGAGKDMQRRRKYQPRR